jgi:hypothetical protein
MNPPFPVRCLPPFPVFFVEDLGEKCGVLKNPRKIVEEATGAAARAVLR